MPVNQCSKCGQEFETKNPKRIVCPNCLYLDRAAAPSVAPGPPPRREGGYDGPPPQGQGGYPPQQGQGYGGPPQGQGGYGRPQGQGYGPPQGQGGYGRPQGQGYGPPQGQGGYGRPQGQGYGPPQGQGGYGRPQGQGYGPPQGQGGYGRPQGQGYGPPQGQGGYGRPPGQQGYGPPQGQGGYGRPPGGPGGFQQRPGGFRPGGPPRGPGGFNRGPGGPRRGGPPKKLLVPKEALIEIEKLYRPLLPLPNPDAHVKIGEQLGMEPNKVFFGINLIRQKMFLPKLEYPKRPLAVTPDQLAAVKALYEPFLPVPPIGLHKILAKQLRMDEWRVHVAIGLIRKQMAMPRWNEDRDDLPPQMKEQLAALQAQKQAEAAAAEAAEASDGAGESPTEEAVPVKKKTTRKKAEAADTPTA